MSQPSTQIVHDADRLAAKAHRGQRRAHGAAYIEHPRAVARILRALEDAGILDLGPEAQAAALLHDVIEDSDLDAAAIEKATSENTAAWTSVLTKAPAEDSTPNAKRERDDEYYRRLTAHDDTAKFIKVADRVHNLSELHLCDDAARARRYIEETRAHVMPLAESIGDDAGRAAMVAILTDAIAACARACLLRDVAPPATAGLYPVVMAGPHTSVDDVKGMVLAAVNAGAPLIQFRAKNAPDRIALLLTQAAASVVDAYGAVLVVNDRADLACLANVPFVHLGQQDLLPIDAAGLYRSPSAPMVYGRSTHQGDELERALGVEVPPNSRLAYVAVGPIHASSTKRGHADVIGVDTLRERVRQCGDVPVCAVGGLTSAARIAAVARAGVTYAATAAGVDPRLTTDDGRHRPIDYAAGTDPLTPNDLHEARLRCRILQSVFCAAAATAHFGRGMQ